MGLSAAGQFVEARAAIDDGLDFADRMEAHWIMPESLRVKGEILRLNAREEAEDCFQKSLDWARRQGALSWEVRAATSLAKLWRVDGKIAEARKLLSDVRGRFTEGFDTADLRAACAVIDELG